MKHSVRSFLGGVLALTAASLGCFSCVQKNEGLGGNLIPSSQQYDLYTAEFELQAIEMRMADSLSGYSSSRMAIGAIRDSDFGLTTRSCALTIVPFYDSLDFGENTVLRQFHFSAVADSVSVPAMDQAHILQNLNVYELTQEIGGHYDTNGDLTTFIGPRATDGTLVYNGTDSLSFDFSAAYAQKYIDACKADRSLCDSISRYLDKLPGIIIEAEAPVGAGGRINLFDLQLEYDKNYYITGNYAEMKFTADYDGVRKDTSFLFYFSPAKMYDIDSLLTHSKQGSLPQYCFNHTGHSSRTKEGVATDVIRMEGGGGLKPVVTADEILSLMAAEIGSHCSDISKAVVNKATLVFPYKFVYEDMFKYPQILSPTCRIRSNENVAFAGLTDASAKDENQGERNASLKRYSPDITYHAQELLKKNPTDDLSNYDIWFLAVANETRTSTTSGSSSSNDMSDYYRYLMYNSYYNNMYGGYGGYGYGGYGYGGYGGYGYGDYYSNYYSYAMAAMYMQNSNTSSTSTTQELDKDRYYNAYLYGPQEADPALRPKLIITYAIPKNQE